MTTHPLPPKHYVIGDSIAHGTAEALKWPGDYQDGRSYAIIAHTVIPHNLDVLVVSTLTNPQPKSHHDWLALEPSLVKIREGAGPKTKVVWILPSPKFRKERQVVIDFAHSHQDKIVSFVPGMDGIHPESYHHVATAVLASLSTA